MDDYLNTFIYSENYLYCISHLTTNGTGYGDDYDCGNGYGSGWGDGYDKRLNAGGDQSKGSSDNLEESIRISNNG
jgi:hypothetical protein